MVITSSRCLSLIVSQATFFALLTLDTNIDLCYRKYTLRKHLETLGSGHIDCGGPSKSIYKSAAQQATVTPQHMLQLATRLLEGILAYPPHRYLLPGLPILFGSAQALRYLASAT